MLPLTRVLPREFVEVRSRYTLSSKKDGQLRVAFKQARTLMHPLPPIQKPKSRDSPEKPKSDDHEEE